MLGFCVYIIPKNSVLKKNLKKSLTMLLMFIFAREGLELPKLPRSKNPSACKSRASRDRETETSGPTIPSLARKKGRFWKKLSQKSGKVIFQQKPSG